MPRPKTTPQDRERTFDIEELFFSTTDRRGVILSGNEVFVRVSAHENLDVMIGRPHNIIRHPDMPRAVFRLLWDYLEAGRPIAAYVKNMARDGCHYWVMALIVPIEEGYLSVRFKPTSPIFAVVRGLYAEMREIERAAGDEPEARRRGMEAAGVRLSEALTEKGFADYDTFMQHALATELASRRAVLSPAHATTLHPAESVPELASVEETLQTCRTIDASLDHLFDRVDSLLRLNEKLVSQSVFLSDLSRNVTLASLNAVIASHRLREGRNTLSVVTQNLAWISGDSTRLVDQMTGRISALVRSLNEMAFAICAAKLQVEMAVFFATELLQPGTREMDTAARRRTLSDLATLVGSFSASTRQMLGTIPRVREPIHHLNLHEDALRDALRTLSSVHVLGKVEAAQVGHAEQFDTLFRQIQEQIDRASEEMRGFAGNLLFVREHLPQIGRTGDSVNRTLTGFAARRAVAVAA